MSDTLEQGYTKVETPEGAHFCESKAAARLEKVAPADPKPVKGGFVPLNNVNERI